LVSISPNLLGDMRIPDLDTDKAILEELGVRLRQARLARNISQGALAQEAGVARFTLQRIEEGQPSSTTNLIKLLRALDLLEGLDGLLPEGEDRPVDRMRRRSERRRRAGSPRKPSLQRDGDQWRWGDESEAKE
jgi:transcriptional regulator with XRE-family HTH domain